MALGLVALALTLPLEWTTLRGVGPGYLKPFHLAVIALGVAALCRWRPGSLIRPVWRRHGALFGLYALLLGVFLTAGLAFAQPFESRATVFRQATYAVSGLLVAATTLKLAGRPAQRWIAPAAILAPLVLVAALALSLAAQGQSIVSLVGQAVSRADPDIIANRLLRGAFRNDANLSEVNANLRHNVFGGLLVALLLGLACAPALRAHFPRLRRACLAGALVAMALVVLSLSRSTTLCLALILLLPALRVLARGRARTAHVLGAVATVLVAAIVVLSPLGTLFANRITSTGSYESRIAAAGSGFVENAAGAAVIGTSRASVDKTPHNFVLRSWLGGGVVAAVVAAAILLYLSREWVREVRYYLRGDPWPLPFGQVWVLGLGLLPLVRAFTAGGHFHIVEWVAIGLFLGFTAAAASTRG